MTEEQKNKKKENWIKKRHLYVSNIARVILWPYVRLKYGVKIERFREQGKRPYLIISNHQTAFDQFFVGYVFSGAIYFIASEDIFSMGFISDLLRWAVNPIPIKKQSTDIAAVRNCLRVAKEGGTIALFPEGNRTYSGRTVYINPAIVMLAKRMGLPIAIMNIEGGYGINPRWAEKVRRGRMRAYVKRVIEPEEYRALDDASFVSLIEKELYVDEARVCGEYTGKNLAEYLERAIYYCPKCNALSTFESDADEMECKVCGMKIRYLPTKVLVGVNFDLPYRFVADWYDAQNDFVNSLDLTLCEDEPIYCEKCNFDEVLVYKFKKEIYKDADIKLFGNRIEILSGDDKVIFSMDDIRAITVCGKNKLNLYFGDKLYQITGGKRFNALKYVNLTFRCKNIKKEERGEGYDKFLGL